MNGYSLEEFYSYLWHKKWRDVVLNDPELARRRKRSHNLKMVSLDKEKILAVFQSSGRAGAKDNVYFTTLTDCTCKDFALGHGERPCKHIFRLAEELGVFQNEYFEEGETDYTLELREQEYFAPKIPLELGLKLMAVADREGVTLNELVNASLEQFLDAYLQQNNLTLTAEGTC